MSCRKPSSRRLTKVYKPGIELGPMLLEIVLGDSWALSELDKGALTLSV
jgi:hypothetical protein